MWNGSTVRGERICIGVVGQGHAGDRHTASAADLRHPGRRPFDRTVASDGVVRDAAHRTGAPGVNGVRRVPGTTTGRHTRMSEQTATQEGKTYPPDQELSKTANVRPEMLGQDLQEFWSEQAQDKISWYEPFDTVLEWNLPYAKWFVGGKLNACYNCVDRHVENGKGDKVALHVVPDDGPDSSQARDITFSQLQEQVVKYANGLKKLGVSKGVPVGIYMQMIPQAVVPMLACARLGAPHTVVFGGFGGKAAAAGATGPGGKSPL